MSETRHPGFDGSMDLGFGPDPSPPAAPQTPGTVTLTQEQFQAMLDRINRSQEADYVQALGEEIPEPLTAEQLMEQIPDPRQDPDGFRRNLAGMLVNAREELGNIAATTATNEAARSNILDQAWNAIREGYPEVAEHPDLVELATSRERAAMASRNQDIMVAMTQNLDGVVERIASRASASLRNIRGQSGQDDGTPDEPDILRSGNFSRPRPAQREQAPAPTSLVDELKAIQSKLGIY